MGSAATPWTRAIGWRICTPCTFKEGVISGQIERGRGYTVRLLRGNTAIAEQKTYKFEGLPSGAYWVQAVGPPLDSDALQLDTNHAQAPVNPTPPQS